MTSYKIASVCKTLLFLLWTLVSVQFTNANGSSLSGPRRDLLESNFDLEKAFQDTLLPESDLQPPKQNKGGCFKAGVVYQGTKVGQPITVLNPRQCQLVCQTNSKCSLFSYQLKQKTCTLYAQGANLVANPLFISGNKKNCAGRCGKEGQQCCVYQSCRLRLQCLSGSCIASPKIKLPGPGSGCLVKGEKKLWHKVVIQCKGPAVSEKDTVNPFTEYSMQVTFTNGGETLKVPGFFAADGNAANTGAQSGQIWQTNFMPTKTGTWRFTVSFVKGRNAYSSFNGVPTAFNGFKSQIQVSGTDKPRKDNRSQGLLKYINGHYYQFQGSKQAFIKVGANSPENLLAYDQFDGTTRGRLTPLHSYQPHAKDFKAGDPTWRGGRGKNIIGAMNYLASQGVNSMYFLTMNIKGDGDDVWPYTDKEQRFRFDVSKLAQWEIVFEQMTKLGIQVHVLTQETENDKLLDRGELGPQRTIYYRELIARFGHHPSLMWNLGEEHKNGPNQVKQWIRYFQKTDPYGHPVVIHTYPSQHAKYNAFLGFPHFSGPSMQIGNPNDVYEDTLLWYRKSSASGRKWAVATDEIGPAGRGALPDSADPQHNSIRSNTLWGNLMAGGYGVEWYFGYQFPHNDLNLEDFRSRANLWKQSTVAKQFFIQYVPVFSSKPITDNSKYSKSGCYTFGSRTKLVVYCKSFGGTQGRIKLPGGGNWSVRWYDPIKGGMLQTGSVSQVSGGAAVGLGNPPKNPQQDWAVLISKM